MSAGITSSVALEPSARPRLALVTRGLQRVATLPTLLHDWQLVHGRVRGAGSADAVLAWGHRPSAVVAADHAQRHRLPLLRAEDGFLRSVELGHTQPPLSIVLDDIGMHFDASRPSRLEPLIARPLTPSVQERGAALREAWVQARVSKYNHAPEGLGIDLAGASSCVPPFVLVVDQTAGDASIAAGGADARSFTAMLEAALDEHPHARILLKVHPAVVAGRARGHFDRLSSGQAARVTIVGHDVHPPALLERCDAVYVVGSLIGFEALLWQRPVRCFGMPFYAGWGLTRDQLRAPARRASVALESLVFAALVDYARYVDPETGATCGPERLIAHLALQRRMRTRFEPRLHALGFSRWKKPIARAFFGGSELNFLRSATEVTTHATKAESAAPVVVWGAKPAPPAANVIRVEDGFIRSVGLGADLTRPLSWVQDDLGIYFDATRPSRLEALLESGSFDAALLARARALREAIVAAGITKYNVGVADWTPPRSGKPRVLVPGQVDSDASIAWGKAQIGDSLSLLRAARASRPDAHLIYKPHPDVLAGLRGGSREARAALDACTAHCDEVVTAVPMGRLLDAVDEVHVLTSLAGFEALLRGKAVVTWGLPFYAGWGLTEDRTPATSPALLRRTRRVTLDELAAATLILYPAYVSRVSGAFTTPERALEELLEWQRSGRTDAARSPWHALKRLALVAAARWQGR